MRTNGIERSPALFSLCCFLFPLILHGQSRVDADSLAGDLRAYTSFIRNKHVHPFDASRKATFDLFEAQIARNVHGLTRDSFITDIMRLAALVNDEHTMVWPERTMWLPYRLRVLDDGIVIIATDSAHSAHALHRILSINGMAMERVVDLLSQLVKGDNASYVTEFINWHLDDPAILMGLGVFDRSIAIPFELLSSEGDTVRTTVDAKEGPAPTLLRATVLDGMLAHGNTSNYWFQYDAADRSLYFQYRRCQEDIERPFSAFNADLFALIDRERPERLIIDLRFNGGGASAVLQPFLRKIRKSYLNAEGRIRVLIGPGVFSSALMNAADLKRNTSALFIGRMTGSNINHYGELRSMELPYTRARVTCSTKWWENWKGMVGGLRPDVEVPVTWADLIQGLDRALEVAKQR